ncbi:MAG: choice-of-anchor D domain-containing protein [Gammaproteobacteria bacterium]
MDVIQGLSERQKATRWVVRLMVVFWAMFFAAPASAQTASVTPTATTLNFGSIAQGSSSAAQTVTITNSSATNVTLRLVSINITGANAGSFVLSNGCGSTLARRASCTVRVTFRPQAQGALQALLSISTNATNVPGGLFTKTLTGTGTAPVAVLAVAPTSLAFGSVGLNTTSGPRFVTVTNNGLGTLTFTAPQSISTQTGGAGFAVPQQCTGSLAQGQSCVVGVTFTPTTTGSKTGTLRIYTNVSTTGFAVSLTGTATTPTPVLTLSPTRATLTCSTPYGGPVFFPITASNTGTANVVLGAITFTGSGGPFFSQTNACPVPFTPGAACNIVVKFSPTGRTQRTATMTVNSNGGNRTVSLTGTCRSHPSP